MAKKFSLGKSFIDYITMIGFKEKETSTDKKYYVDSKGKQIRLDYDSKEIAFLDNHGNLVESSSSFTIEEVDKFSQFTKN